MYSIAAAKLSKKIDQIIFSTDDKEYKNIAESYGLEVPFLRPESFSTDLSTDRDFLQLVNNRISVWSPIKKKMYTPNIMREEFGIDAKNYLLY